MCFLNQRSALRIRAGLIAILNTRSFIWTDVLVSNKTRRFRYFISDVNAEFFHSKHWDTDLLPSWVLIHMALSVFVNMLLVRRPVSRSHGRNGQVTSSRSGIFPCDWLAEIHANRHECQNGSVIVFAAIATLNSGKVLQLIANIVEYILSQAWRRTLNPVSSGSLLYPGVFHGCAMHCGNSVRC